MFAVALKEIALRIGTEESSNALGTRHLPGVFSFDPRPFLIPILSSSSLPFSSSTAPRLALHDPVLDRQRYPWALAIRKNALLGHANFKKVAPAPRPFVSSIAKVAVGQDECVAWPDAFSRRCASNMGEGTT